MRRPRGPDPSVAAQNVRVAASACVKRSPQPLRTTQVPSPYTSCWYHAALAHRDGAQQVVAETPLAGRPLDDLVGGAGRVPGDARQQPAVPPRGVGLVHGPWPLPEGGPDDAHRGHLVVGAEVVGPRLPRGAPDAPRALGVAGQRAPAAGGQGGEVPRGSGCAGREGSCRCGDVPHHGTAEGRDAQEHHGDGGTHPVATEHAAGGAHDRGATGPSARTPTTAGSSVTTAGATCSASP